MAAQLQKQPTALGKPENARAAAPASWFTTVTQGNMQSFMPPFNSKLSDQQRWDVVAYILSLGTTPDEIAKGKTVPKTMVMPVLTITQSMLPQFKNTALTTTASQVFPASWYQAHLLAHVAANNGQGPGCTGSKSATSAAGCK